MKSIISMTVLLRHDNNVVVGGGVVSVALVELDSSWTRQEKGPKLDHTQGNKSWVQEYAAYSSSS